MSTVIECLLRRGQCAAAGLALAGLALAGSAKAAERPMPKQLLNNPAQLQQFFIERIGRPAASIQVVELTLRDDYVALVTRTPDGAGFETWTATPRRAIQHEAEGYGVSCPGLQMPLSGLDFAVGARVLADIRSIIEGNGFDGRGIVQAKLTGVAAGGLGAAPCHHLAWFESLNHPGDPMRNVRLEWLPDGSGGQARTIQLQPVSLAKLLAGDGRPRPQPAPPPPAPAPKVIDTYLSRGIAPELAQLEAELGAPLRLTEISYGDTTLWISVLDARGKNVARHVFYLDGRRGEPDIRELYFGECKRPFTVNDFPLARLPELAAQAPASIPPMRAGWTGGVVIGPSVLGCRKPPTLRFRVEDERASGRVVMDGQGRVLEAEVK